VRLEDTDRERYMPEGVPLIFRDLLWLGLDWDEGPDLATLAALPGVSAEAVAGLRDRGGPHGPYVQSQRLPIYRQYIDELLAKGLVYRCDCTSERLDQMRLEQQARKQPPGYDRRCRNKAPGEVDPAKPHVIRLKVPLEGETRVDDLVRGEIVWENRYVEDQILLKSDGFPTYHFAVVVDDHLMDISHILRGEDWIPSTPNRSTLPEPSAGDPVFVHLPLVNGEDGRKLATPTARPR
jgi:glutamyl-tRNA synthetase